jgi:hypothetical protein
LIELLSWEETGKNQFRDKEPVKAFDIVEKYDPKTNSLNSRGAHA